MITAQDGGKFVSLLAGRIYPQEILLVLFMLEVESTPGPYCHSNDFMLMKNSIDTSWNRN